MSQEPAPTNNGAKPDPQTKKCPDGYTMVFGVLCVEKSKLEAAAAFGPNIPEIPSFTTAPCEAALATLQEAQKTIQNIMQLPKKLANVAKKLMNRPFQAAQKLVDDALSVLDIVDEAIDQIIGGGAAELQKLKRALQDLLECPIMADTAMGALAASIIDAIDEGGDLTQLIGQFKGMLNNMVQDQLNELKKTPMEAIQNAEKAFQDALVRSGLPELMRFLEMLEQCVQALCDIAEVAERLPQKAKDMWESIGGTWKAAPEKLTATTKRMGGTFMEEWNQAAAAASHVKGAVATTFKAPLKP